MDVLSAEHLSTRRNMIGTVGALAATGILIAGRAAAAAPPYTPTQADARRLLVMMKLELTASALYRSSLAAGIGGEATQVADVYATNHSLYAQAIAGVTGLSASGRLDEVYTQFEPRFATADIAGWAEAAYELESTFVATHTEAIARFEAIESVNLITSILAVEARQAVVAASIGGFSDDPTVLTGESATPIDLEAEVAA